MLLGELNEFVGEAAHLGHAGLHGEEGDFAVFALPELGGHRDLTSRLSCQSQTIIDDRRIHKIRIIKAQSSSRFIQDENIGGNMRSHAHRGAWNNESRALEALGVDLLAEDGNEHLIY